MCKSECKSQIQLNVGEMLTEFILPWKKCQYSKAAKFPMRLPL